MGQSHIGEVSTQRVSARASLHPRLLLLAPLLATVVFFAPNLRVMRDVCGLPAWFSNVGMAAMAGCLAVASAFILTRGFRRAFTSLPRPMLIASAAAFTLTQVLLWALCLAGVEAPLALMLDAAVMGMCLPPLLTAWERRFDVGFRDILQHGALVCLLCASVTWLISLLPPSAAMVLWCLCAAVGSFAPIVGAADHDEISLDEGAAPMDGPSVTTPDAGRASHATPRLTSALTDLVSNHWVALIGFLLCLACSSMTEISIDGHVVRGELVGLVVAAAVVFALCQIRTTIPLVLLISYVAVPALIAIGLVLFSVSGTGMGTTIGASFVFVPMTFVSIYAVASIVAMKGFSRVFVSGVVLCAACLAIFVGSAINWIAADEQSLGPIVGILMSSYFGLVIVQQGISYLCTLLRGVHDEGGDAAEGRHAEIVEEARQSRVDDMARDFALTAREHDVLDYLSRGYNSQNIAKALFISTNTVRTHMRNIYRKLGINTHEQLLIMFNEGYQFEPQRKLKTHDEA